jgi:hypothetical protein
VAFAWTTKPSELPSVCVSVRDSVNRTNAPAVLTSTPKEHTVWHAVAAQVERHVITSSMTWFGGLCCVLTSQQSKSRQDCFVRTASGPTD